MKRSVLLISLACISVLLAGIFVYMHLARSEVKEDFREVFAKTAGFDRRAAFAAYYPDLKPSETLDVLENLYPLCHGEAHELGKVIFEKTRDIDESIRLCAGRCAGGCFHGVLMEVFQDIRPAADAEGHLDLPDIRSKINDICEDSRVSEYHKKGKCAHGIGHALLYLAGYDIGEALSFCKLFGDRPKEFYCAGGVFMEYESVYGKRDLDERPLFYPCDEFGEFPAACFTFKGQYMRTHLGDVNAFAQACLELHGFSRWGCFRGLGFAYVDQVADIPSRINDICAFGAEDDKKMCVEGAMEVLVQSQENTARRVCIHLEGEMKPFCEEILQRGSHSLEKSFALHF